MAYIKEKGLERFVTLGGYELCASKSDMLEVYEAALAAGSMLDIVHYLSDGESGSFASFMEEYGNQSFSEAAGRFRNDAFSLYLANGNTTYRVIQANLENEDFDVEHDFWGVPVEGSVRAMPVRSRSDIVETLLTHEGIHPGQSILFNMYVAVLAKLAHTFGDEEDEKKEEPAEQESHPQEKVVIRERVIEREKEPELEGVFRSFMAEAITKVAVDDMVPRIKEKIIEEFGIEPQKHIIKIADKGEHDVKGVVHERFDIVMHYLANKIPVYMYGPTGSGKGELVKQIAKALDTEFYAMNSVTDEFKISGFVDANGIYHETEFFKAFVHGGLFFLDEMDASAPEVLVCMNMAIADGYFSFPNGRFEAHEDFRIVAAGNTLGTGADAMYTGRLQLDAASLNRFAVVPVGYDERIDRFAAQNDDELVAFAKQYRDALRSCGLPGTCSYRNIMQIKASEGAMSDEEAICYCLTKEMNKDDINTIVGRDIFDSNNRYFKALKKVVPMV